MIAAWPCDGCDVKPDSWRCPCVMLNAAEDIADLAHTTASAIACMHHIERQSRDNLAASTCDAIANALDDVGAELDSDAFMAACGARERTTK